MAKSLRLGFLVLFVLMMGLTGCSDNSSETDGEGNGTAQEEWITVFEFSGSFSGDEREAYSDLFEVTGGELRVTCDLVTTSVSGNAMIYILPEGWTKTTNAQGALKISVQDISVLGNTTAEQHILNKDAGKYFLDINSSSVESYSFKIEEKR